jgi:hypothetical protein
MTGSPVLATVFPLSAPYKQSTGPLQADNPGRVWLGQLLAARKRSLLLAVALLIGPLLLVPIVPTQDGPFHLAQSQWLAEFGWRGERSALVARFMEWNPRIDPYIGPYPLLAGLLWLGVDTLLAYKAIFVLYGLLWLASTWVIARGSRQPVIALLLCAPLAFGQFLHAGFLNYVYGLLGFFVFAALRQGTSHWRPAPRALLTMAAGTVLAIMHFVAIIAGVLFVCAEFIASWTETRRGSSSDQRRSKLKTEVLVPALAILPALALAMAFLWATRHQSSVADVPHMSWPLGLKSLLTADHLVAYQRVEMVWALACLLALLGVSVCAWQLRHEPWSTRARQWGWFAVLVAVVTVIEVRNAQGVSFSQRLVPLAWAAVAFVLSERLSLQARSWWVRFGPALLMLMWVGLLGQTVTRIQAYSAWAEPLMAVWQAGLSRPQQTFVSSIAAGSVHQDHPSLRVQPLLHANQLAAVASHGVGLSSPVNSTLIFGYAPLRYRLDNDWFATWPNWEARPQDGPAFDVYSDRHAGAPSVYLVSGEAQAAAQLAQSKGMSACTHDRSVLVCTRP